MDDTITSALEEACRAVDGPSRLAQLLTARGRKTSKASVSRWKKDGVPPAVCPDIEDLTGVACERLYPNANWSALRKRRKPQKAGAQ